MNENTNVKLSSPLVIFFKQLCKLFMHDPDINIQWEDTEGKDYENRAIEILVDSEDKYNALTQLMPPKKEFGNVKVQIRVVPSNKEKTELELFEILFKNNPVFCETIERTLPAGDVIGHLMFRPKVAQYYADNITDPYGNNNELYADIAREVFGERDGLYYNTDLTSKE